jgi:hypothetical protein
MSRLPLVLSLLLCCYSVVHAQGTPFAPKDPNGLIVSLTQTMPVGGGYSASASATRDLQSAVQVQGGRLHVDPSAAPTTYCSGATYLVFLQAIKSLVPESQFGPGLAQALAIKGQPDGVGIWGRWNANGPGTACLFRELKLGRNFTSFDEARGGDFMKIFWNTAVGRREHGHSVIYLGRVVVNGVERVRFWSSNQPGGYGYKDVPRSRISYAIFSRLESPANIEYSVNLPVRNNYLAGLTAKESSISEALAESAVTRGE